MSNWVAIPLGSACGAALAWWTPLLNLEFSEPVFSLIGSGLRTIGPMAWVLLPMGIWLLLLAVQRVLSDRAGERGWLMQVAFIERNAPQIGLLGTLLALASASPELAQAGFGDPARQILAVLPMVGEALTSTVAGLLLALTADLLSQTRNETQTKVACP